MKVKRRRAWLRYDAEQAKVPKEPIPANGIQAETQNQTRQIVVADSEVRDSSVPNNGTITKEERSDMTSKQSKSFIRETSFRLRLQSKMEVRSNKDRQSDRKIRYTRSVLLDLLTRIDSAGRMLQRVPSLDHLMMIKRKLEIII